MCGGHPCLALPEEELYDYDINNDEDLMLNDSAKLQALVSLVNELIGRKHRILIFFIKSLKLTILNYYQV